jgi:hypothetical protein
VGYWAVSMGHWRILRVIGRLACVFGGYGECFQGDDRGLLQRGDDRRIMKRAVIVG